MKKNKKFYIRKAHRYLGIFIGIQFLAWTVSGIYFSWTNIHEIRGNHLVQHPHFPIPSEELTSIQSVLLNFSESNKDVHIHEVKLIEVLGNPHYQIAFSKNLDSKRLDYQLFNAYDGSVKGELSEKEAVQIANSMLKEPFKIIKIDRLEETNSHHEYRGKPLPAWAISYDEPNKTIYIGATTGVFQSVRHDGWRIFDALWMFHTMDFAGRDNFNNWLLRVFSVFSLFTVFSGFVLYFSSSSMFQSLIKKLKK